MARSSLTPKQARFVEEYLLDLNGTQAAIRAGYSPRTARSTAADYLTKPNIQTAIHRAQLARSQRTEVSADRVLKELACLGYSNVWHYQVDDENNLILSPDAPPEAIRAVSSIKRKTRIIPQKDREPIIERELEFRLWDKNIALTNLGKHLSLFTDRLELVGPMAEAVKDMAAEYGMTVEEVLAEAEALTQGQSR